MMIEERLAHGYAELADLYQRLFRVTARGQAVAFTGRVRGGEPETAPTNVLIIDAITALEQLVLDLEAGLRDALGFAQAQYVARGDREHGGWALDPRVGAALGWLADAATTVVAAGYGEHCVGLLYGNADTRGAIPQARSLLGLSERPVRFQRDCPMCGCRSLLAPRPSQGVVVCVNPPCRDAEGRQHRWSVDDWSPYAVSPA
ncbi:MAG TPA: hypothetical protein VG276_19090 [Actinomycetes bacterium]|jgi:hypothetical protein|nr:hypothetical protein [Actinomycetes bacterium]